MLRIKNVCPRRYKVAIGSLLSIGLLTIGTPEAWSQDRSKPETIEATAMGTEAQMGKEFPVTLIIYEYSAPSDRQILIDAFHNDKNQGLFNALSKMKAVGHIAVTGTLGYDVSYIEMIPTSTGRTIRFVTNRLLRFGELYRDSLSRSYNLTAGEIDINDEDNTKSMGVFYPETRLALDKQGVLQFDLIGFPWQLVDILDWKGTPGVN